MVALIDKPSNGQKTETQYRLWGGSVFGAGIWPQPGIETSLLTGATAVWPGWASMLWGTYWTYRAMARHPTIAKATSDALSPVLGSSWLIDADEDAPKDATQWVQDNIIARRGKIIAHAVRSVILGNSPFETVWNTAGGNYIIDDFVPLLPDQTTVRRENNGKGPFAGIENGQAKLSRAECLFIRNRSDAISDEPGDDYGRSRYENFRDTAWTGWLDTARKLAELEDRVSGIVPVWEVPKTVKDDDGKTMKDYAAAALPSLVHPRSQGVVIENPAIGEIDPDEAPQRYKQLQSQLKPLDLGERAASQAAMLAKLQYYDSLIARGMYRSERTMMATQGGTKADAEQHAVTSEPDAEAIDNMIAEQINEQPIRTGLSLNFGADILKKVRGIKPSPLVDEEAAKAERALTELTVKDEIAKALAETYDMDKLIEQSKRPTRDGVKFADVLSQIREAAKKMLPGEPGNPPAGGNGNVIDPRVKRGMMRIAARVGK